MRSLEKMATRSWFLFTGVNFLEAFTPALPYFALVVGALELTVDPDGNVVAGSTGTARSTR
ncbi:hypothetical protein BH18ACI5_BH18ACI5_05720 [soil metagenome]